ncbi:hypothetical protein B0I35DRAFT_358349 [Stachybotrys elegans]|uniref:Zn(2)-C6 fungal-type domain-containing protein n=1 Tax=Stachybotrys elegans TaxID=80388 RepID=A0A8K0SP25_9HYPO|nr:hypothetical protein B0I35DRAFT_358349 [Stachybotrys elegans]
MDSPLVTRRNGKLQACEPCRRRKVACDHEYPVCRRCRRRPNGEAMCHYLTPDQESGPGPVESSGPRRPPTAASVPVARSTSPQQTNRHIEPNDRIWSSPAARAPAGFFGSISILAAYLETETTLAVRSSVAFGTDASAPINIDTSLPSPVEIQDMVNRDRGANFLAVKILQAIPKHSPTITLFQPHIDPNDEWMKKIGERLLDSFWLTFGHYFRAQERDVELSKLGSMICINTRKSCKEDHDDPVAWIDSFSGQNMRWEAIGLIFVCAAFGEISASASSNADHGSRLAYFTECCSSCITLANMGGSSGSLMLFLLHKRSVLQACMHGETSLPYWKSHAEAVAMLTFSGYHDDHPRNPSAAPIETTIALEARRRVACQIFIMDKFLATVVGRPPLLARRFCSLPLPLGLDDATLLSDKETFQRHVHLLDPDGWNVDGRFHYSSLLRARMMVALLRDEILEVGLGSSGNHQVDDIMRLRIKQRTLYEGLPAHVLWSPTSEESSEVDHRTVYPKLLIKLDYLLNIFLLERILLRHGYSRSHLLRTSFEMMVLTLHLWTEKRIWVEMNGEFQLLIMGYAAPAGAVLCMELIDPNPVDMTREEDEEIVAGEVYSKSSIIQQLSLFVGYLQSYPSQGKGSVAADVRGIIKRVLDHVLNARRPQAEMNLDNFDLAANWDNFAQFSPLSTINWFN